ncbi:MAG TPA: hypothetical protein VFR91_06870 [Dyella sp.]|nr:hypothetical protein [Dyella sp.]
MAPAGSPTQGFSFWRIGLWLVLMLAAFGALQYGVHAQRVWRVLGQPALAGEARSMLHGMLAWDLGYFVAAVVLVVLCAAGILRQGWSRPVLRVALTVLALGILASGLSLLRRWQAWSDAPHDVADAAALLSAQARTVHLSLAFDALAVALLAWLIWQLGRPSVRAGFRRR